MASKKIVAYSKKHRACEICGSRVPGVRIYSDGTDPTLRALCRPCRNRELNSFGIMLECVREEGEGEDNEQRTAL